MKWIGCLMLPLLLTASALAQKAPTPAEVAPRLGVLKDVGIDQKLGASLPLDAPFTDEYGQTIPLRQVLSGRPIILVLNYFACPQLCGLVLNDLSRSLKVMPLVAGRDFDVVAVSFDPRDTAQIARKKRDNYVADYEHVTGHTGTRDGWRFLTGKDPSIHKLCDAVGFRYAWDESKHQYAHAAGVMIVTPQGRVARYFYGIDYRPNDLRLSLAAAQGEKLSSPVERVLLYCFAYDPSTGKYSLAIWRLIKVMAGVTVVGVGSLVAFLLWRERRNPRAKAVPA